MKKQFNLVLAVALLAGFIGGAVSSQIIQPVFAEKNQGVKKVIRAQEFQVVSDGGRVLGKLRGDKAEMGCIFEMYSGEVGKARFDILGISYELPDGYLELSTDEFRMVTKEGSGIRFYAKYDLPCIEVYQKHKCRARLGGTELEIKKTGTKIIRSAASLVLFDEKGNVIWETPD